MKISAILNRALQPLLSVRKQLALGAVLAISGAAAIAPAQTPATSGNSTHAYDIQLSKTPLSFTQPANQYYYYFRLRPSVELRGQQYLFLDYSYSSTVVPSDASISVMLNGTPIEAVHLTKTADRHATLQIPIPIKNFKLEFNELRITVRQFAGGVNGERVVNGNVPCPDDDSSANWVRFDRSILHLERKDQLTFPLYAYPFPFLDTLENNPVQATYVLPTAPKPSLVGEALSLASDWGRYETSRGLPIQIIQGGPTQFQNVLLETTSSSGAGQISVTPGTRPGESKLHIGGASDEGLDWARKALSFPDIVQQLQSASQAITAAPLGETPNPTTRLGTFTFNELGQPRMELRGAYRQSATLTIQRPIRCDLGRQSFIEIHFRHSANLNPLRSAISIRINDHLVGSQRLDDENANGGILRAQIPVSELTKNLWVFEITAYHDLASIDCSKSYDTVAWTLVDGESAVLLANGTLGGRPYLDAFPYLVDSEGTAPDTVSISLPQNPSNDVLSLAGTIAARAAQMNRRSFNWNVNYGDVPQSKRSSIVLGYYSDAGQRLSSIQKNLLVYPNNGTFKIDPGLRMLPTAPAGGAVLQAVRAPGADNEVLYVLLAENDAAMRKFANYLADPRKAVELSDEVAVMTGDGKMISISTVSDAAKRDSQTKEQDSYTKPMNWVSIGLIVLLVIAIILIFRAFMKRT